MFGCALINKDGVPKKKKSELKHVNRTDGQTGPGVMQCWTELQRCLLQKSLILLNIFNY